ncbi:MAG: hypothetical protein CK424_01545 [Legionella sp.]|nr:MAG: hypothetical protein CK424_01545 [Legionella sp.]
MQGLRELKRFGRSLHAKLDMRNYIGEPVEFAGGTYYRVKAQNFEKNQEFIQNVSKPGHTTIIATPSVAKNGAKGAETVKELIAESKTLDKTNPEYNALNVKITQNLHTPGHIGAYRPGSKPGELTEVVSHRNIKSSLKQDIKTTMDAPGLDSYIAVIPDENLPHVDTSRKVNAYNISATDKNQNKPDNCATAASLVLLGKRDTINPLTAFKQITLSASLEAIKGKGLSEPEAEKEMNDTATIQQNLGMARDFSQASEAYQAELPATKQASEAHQTAFPASQKANCVHMTKISGTEPQSSVEALKSSASSDVSTKPDISSTNNSPKP